MNHRGDRIISYFADTPRLINRCPTLFGYCWVRVNRGKQRMATLTGNPARSAWGMERNRNEKTLHSAWKRVPGVENTRDNMLTGSYIADGWCRRTSTFRSYIADGRFVQRRRITVSLSMQIKRLELPGRALTRARLLTSLFYIKVVNEVPARTESVQPKTGTKSTAATGGATHPPALPASGKGASRPLSSRGRGQTLPLPLAWSFLSARHAVKGPLRFRPHPAWRPASGRTLDRLSCLVSRWPPTSWLLTIYLRTYVS